MRKLTQILAALLSIGLAVVAVGLAYSTVKGYTTWYFRMSGVVTVDGHETSGYLHASADRTILLVTRTDGKKAETYLVPVAGRAAIWDCGEWTPVRFFPNPVGDLPSRCFAMTNSAKISDAPISSTLVREGRFVSFSTASGKNVKAEW